MLTLNKNIFWIGVLIGIISMISLLIVSASDGFSVGGSRAVVTGSVQEQAMQGCVRCKNVDMVWQTIQGKLGLRDEAATKVWDTTQKKWRPFVAVYSQLGLPGTVVRGNLEVMGLSQFAYADNVFAEAERQGIDACYPLTVIKYESAGNPEAKQAEVNLPVCQSGIRWNFVIQRAPVCNGKTVSDMKALCLQNIDSQFANHNRPKKNVDPCLDAFLDVKTYGVSVPTKNEFCSNNFDGSVRYGLGLGAINILAGERSVTIGGERYTHCELLNADENIKATIALLKEKGASLDSTEAAVRRVFGRYAGQEDTPQVERRYQTFKLCKGQ